MKKFLWAAMFVLAWSSGFVGATLGDRAASPAALLFWRYVLTTLLLATAVCLTGALPAVRAMTGGDVAKQAALGLLSHAVFLGGVFGSAAVGLDAGLSSLICALQPMLVAAAGCLWFGDRLGGRGWAGLGVGIFGVALSVGGVSGTGLAGLWMVVCSLLALSCAALLERRWAPTVPVLCGLLIQCAVATAVFGVFAAASGQVAVRFTSHLWLALTWLVLLSGLGGYAGFTLCLRTLGATRTSALLYLTPAVTMVWAALMFQEIPSSRKVVGLVVVLCGLALGASRKSPTRQLTKR